MKRSSNSVFGALGCSLLGVVIVMALAVVAAAGAAGFALGGGQIENRLLSPSTDTDVSCAGGDCNIVAVSGDRNTVTMTTSERDEGAAGVGGILIVYGGLALVGLVAAWFLSGGTPSGGYR